MFISKDKTTNSQFEANVLVVLARTQLKVEITAKGKKFDNIQKSIKKFE